MYDSPLRKPDPGGACGLMVLAAGFVAALTLLAIGAAVIAQHLHP